LRDELRCEQHAALVRLGRADEADALYAIIDASIGAPLELVQAACLQISALMLRRQPNAAVELSMRMLDRLGFPPALFEDKAAVSAELDTFAAWLAQQSEVSPLAYPEVGEARISAIAMVFERCVRAAFFIDDHLLARLALGAWRLWREHGVCAPMVAPASFIGIVAIRQRADYQLGYQAARFLLHLSEARGYALEAVRVRAVLAVSHAHWREPLEQCTQLARQSYAAVDRSSERHARMRTQPERQRQRSRGCARHRGARPQSGGGAVLPRRDRAGAQPARRRQSHGAGRHGGIHAGGPLQLAHPAGSAQRPDGRT
jgi:hypothetical protein